MVLLFSIFQKRIERRKEMIIRKKEATRAWFEESEKARMRCQKKQNGT
jgi:hypothetical protein